MLNANKEDKKNMPKKKHYKKCCKCNAKSKTKRAKIIYYNDGDGGGDDTDVDVVNDEKGWCAWNNKGFSHSFITENNKT